MKTLLTPNLADLPNIEQAFRSCLHAAAQSSRMTNEETTSFVSHPVAQSIAVAPFAARCRDAQRTSLALLAIYVAANRSGTRETFDHTQADNRGSRRFEVAQRLLEGGDAVVVRAVVARWELVTLYGHARDLPKDLGQGQYNPLAQGGWDFDIKVQELWTDARFGEIEELDNVLGDWNVKYIAW